MGEPDDEVETAAARSIDEDEEPVVEVLEPAFETVALSGRLRSALTELLRLRGCADDSVTCVSFTAARSLNELLDDSLPTSRSLAPERLSIFMMRDDLLFGSTVLVVSGEMALEGSTGFEGDDDEDSRLIDFSLAGGNAGRGGCPLVEEL